MISRRSSQVHTVTLRDIARHAGCSVAAASKVLNHSGGSTKVGPALEERVLAAAKALNYHVNRASSLLRKGLSRTVGIYVNSRGWQSLCSQYSMGILRGVEAAARALDYDLLILNLGLSNTASLCEDRFRERRIDGLIVLYSNGDEPWLKSLLAYTPHIVAVDCPASNPALSRVEFDNRAAIRLLVDHLVARGHRRIGFVGSCLAPPLPRDTQERLYAFTELVREYSLPQFPGQLFCHSSCSRIYSPDEPFCQMEGVDAARHFMAMEEAPTAIIAYNSLCAASMMMELQRQGWKIPEDVSVASIDELDVMELLSPRLTIASHRLEEMGRSAMEVLSALLQSATAPIIRCCAPELILGGSTAPAKNSTLSQSEKQVEVIPL